MKEFLMFFLVVIFSLFIGSQITEGVLLVPYWQALPASQFYSYYNKFGPSIGTFYTVLTIIAALIPIFIAIYCKLIHSKALNFALTSSFFALLFVATFYLYFKSANGFFYQATLSDIQLKSELIVWSYWHWSRVVIELVSLFFLILTLIKIRKQ